MTSAESSIVAGLNLHDNVSIPHANVANIYLQLIARQHHTDERRIKPGGDMVQNAEHVNHRIYLRKNAMRMSSSDDVLNIFSSGSARPKTVSDGTRKRSIAREVRVDADGVKIA